jgi:glycopeptide antibiotics resistance protein
LQDIVRPLGPRGLLLFSTDRALNTWLLVPLGLCAGYLAVRRWWILLLAFMVPVAVEGTQRVVPELGRRCQFQDLIDNTWGLILGAVVGVSLGFVVPWIGRTLRR